MRAKLDFCRQTVWDCDSDCVGAGARRLRKSELARAAGGAGDVRRVDARSDAPNLRADRDAGSAVDSVASRPRIAGGDAPSRCFPEGDCVRDAVPDIRPADARASRGGVSRLEI